jgi:hypothetical protein
MPGRLYLATSKKMVPEQERSSGNTEAGLTQLERDMAENWAWEDILGCLAGTFDTSEWGTNPPYGLERCWQLVASVYYMQMETGGVGPDGKVNAVHDNWLKAAMTRVHHLVSGECALLNSNGDVIRPSSSRQGVVTIGVASPDVNLFPGEDDDTLGNLHTGGSLQEFQKMHGRASLTINRLFPVSL